MLTSPSAKSYNSQPTPLSPENDRACPRTFRRRKNRSSQMSRTDDIDRSAAGMPAGIASRHASFRRLVNRGQPIAFRFPLPSATHSFPPMMNVATREQGMSAVKVTVNGNEQRLAGPTTVGELLEQLKISPKQVAVEINLELVPRTQHASHALRDGDQIEIVGFVGGG